MAAADGTHRYELGDWRNDETVLTKEARLLRHLSQSDYDNPDARDRSRLLHLLGSINYSILTGKRVYIEVGGIVYKTLGGLYWRSVYTGVEHYLLRCQQISGGIWAEGSAAVGLVDLPISRTKEGWTAEGYSLLFMLNRE
jgi:hypothetical protein